MSLWRQLANFDSAPYIIGGLFTGYVLWKQSAWLPWIYSKLSNEFPSPLFSIMGFVLTAVAIIVATNDSGRMTELSDERPQLWRQLVRLFITTAVLAGLFATTLIFMDSTTVRGFPAIGRKIVYGSSLFVFSTLVLLFGTSLYALGKFATAPRTDRRAPSERHRYTVPASLTRDEENE